MSLGTTKFLSQIIRSQLRRRFAPFGLVRIDEINLFKMGMDSLKIECDYCTLVGDWQQCLSMCRVKQPYLRIVKCGTMFCRKMLYRISPVRQLINYQQFHFLLHGRNYRLLPSVLRLAFRKSSCTSYVLFTLSASLE